MFCRFVMCECCCQVTRGMTCFTCLMFQPAVEDSTHHVCSKSHINAHI
jgi:hypothetical protein